MTGPIFVVDGACNVTVNGDNLGYSANGVELIEDAFFGDVPVDLNGGDLGPPGDIQYFGQIDRLRMELSLWDPAVAQLIQPRMNGATPGAITTPGTLVASQGYGYTLGLVPASGTRGRTYSLAIPRQPMQRNKGTRFSRLVIEWECHAVSGVLFTYTGNA